MEKKEIGKSSEALIHEIVRDMSLSEQDQEKLFNKLRLFKKVIRAEHYNSILRLAEDYK